MYPLINGYRIAPIPSSEMLDLSTYLHKMELLNVTHIEVSPTYASLMADIGGGHPALKYTTFFYITSFSRVQTFCFQNTFLRILHVMFGPMMLSCGFIEAQKTNKLQNYWKSIFF